MCDEHPDRPAVVRIQGETDSFGSEMHDCCQECADAIRAERRQATVGRCDWCKKDATDLRHRRDIDEGMAGPVYEVCGPCAKKYDDELRAELDQYDDWHDDDDDFDDDFGHPPPPYCDLCGGMDRCRCEDDRANITFNIEGD